MTTKKSNLPKELFIDTFDLKDFDDGCTDTYPRLTADGFQEYLEDNDEESITVAIYKLEKVVKLSLQKKIVVTDK